MNKDELWQYLIPAMERDRDYQQALQQLKDAEPAYLALLETLSPENREVLERYIAACEAADDILLYLSYQIGTSQRLLLEEKLSAEQAD